MAKLDNVNSRMKIAQEAFFQLKKYGYLAGIIMVVLGVCVFLRPISTSTFFVWLLVFGLLINGISKLVMYFKLPKEFRNGWFLALAILWIAAALMLITDACHMPIETTLSMQAVVGIIIGFNCIFSGINSLVNAKFVEEMGGSKGLTIFSGIIEILCGVIVMSSPLMGLLAMTVAFGLYLIIMGISIIIRSIAY